MKYFLIAGEPSGDKHGSSLIHAIKEKDVNASFCFLGGTMMQEASGLKPKVHIDEMAFMGFVEVLINIRKINSNFRIAKQAITEFKPDVVVMIDYPGFNLRMSKWCKQHNLKVVYYISPSVWAWHKSRVETIRKYTDVMICILPFEEAFYKKHNVNAIYMGNPLYDKIKDFKADEDFKTKFNITKPILALLPGSRVQEIDKLLPVMLQAADNFSQDYEIVIAKSDNLSTSLYEKYMGTKNVKLISNNYYNILSHSDLAIVTSGTATLETALFNVPQVVVYKTNAITYAIAKRLVNIKYISLPNLITNKLLVKELIQEECTAENINSELENLKSKENLYAELFGLMGQTGSAERIGDKIVEIASK